MGSRLSGSLGPSLVQFSRLASLSIYFTSHVVNSFVFTETETEEPAAEADYGPITESHLGHKCHVGNEELN